MSSVQPEYIIEEQIVIQRAMWEQWNKNCKEQFLLTMVHEWWDNSECEPLPPFIEDFLLPVANKFGTVQGANCLATVLFALSQYVEVLDENLQPKDIIVWKDTNGIIQHAAYHMGDSYFLINMDKPCLFLY